MLTWTIWDWFPCECFLEETTLARAGCGKSARPVRRGRGEPAETDNCGRFNSIHALLSTLLAVSVSAWFGFGSARVGVYVFFCGSTDFLKLKF